MEKAKILAIIPYPGLKEYFFKAISSRNDAEVNIFSGNMTDGALIAQKYKDDNFDVIISRGGTALLIGKEIGIPVVEMDITPYDMLRILKMIGVINSKCALVGYENIVTCAKTVSELLEYSIDTFIIQDKVETISLLKDLKRQGYDVIIGDVNTFDASQELGMHGVLLTSGSESVTDAIDKAVLIHKLTHENDKKVMFLKSLLSGCTEHILVTDADDSTVYTNMDMDSEELRTLAAAAVKSDPYATYHRYREIEVAGSVWSVTSNMQTTLQGDQLLVRRIIKSKMIIKKSNAIRWINTTPSTVVSRFYSDAGGLGELQDQIDRYASGKQPVLIVGEKGLGKENLAYIMHDARHSSPILYIDGEKLSMDDMEEFYKGETINNIDKFNVTILIKDIDRTSDKLQQELEQFLRRSKIASEVRLMTTATMNIFESVRTGNFSATLFDLISQLQIHVPPLRDTIKNMDGGIGLVISWLNVELGSQIVGLRPDAMKLFKEFPWTGNVKQMASVLRRLLVLSKGAFIKAEEVEKILQEEENAWETTPMNLQLNGTLDDITKKVIRAVLVEEKMNQTKAADRLNISRSTLWKKLK